MTELNGIYPDFSNIPSHRGSAENCKACLEPWWCNCPCDTCAESRERYFEIRERELKKGEKK